MKIIFDSEKEKQDFIDYNCPHGCLGIDIDCSSNCTTCWEQFADCEVRTENKNEVL